MELLRRFILTFDAYRGALWLEPTSALLTRIVTNPACERGVLNAETRFCDRGSRRPPVLI